MNAHVLSARPTVGAMDEYQVSLDDDDTGRFFIVRNERDRNDSVLKIVRATAIDQNRPYSSAIAVPDGAIEVRGNAVYVNRPMRGAVLAVCVKVEGEWAKKPRKLAPKARIYAESLTIIDRIGELAQELVDDSPPVDENPSDAPGQPKGRRTAE